MCVLGGRFMATFMSLPNYRIAMFVFVFGSDLSVI